jgi:hypothetical protein
MQSTAVMHWLRHLPSAQMRLSLLSQSLFNEHASDCFDATSFELHAGAARAISVASVIRRKTAGRHESREDKSLRTG